MRAGGSDRADGAILMLDELNHPDAMRPLTPEEMDRELDEFETEMSAWEKSADIQDRWFILAVGCAAIFAAILVWLLL